MLVLAVCAAAAEKPGTWIEVRSPHFIVVTNAGEKQGRHVAAQFEQIRSVFSTVYPKSRMDDGKPFTIFGAKDEKSFRTLLPEYWEKKGHFHPAGVFFTTMDKHYVVLRLDEQGSDAYSTVYHEYFHMVESLNFQSLPLWLNEGMADFFANTQFEGKQVNVGKPSGDYLEMFQRRTLLPLAELFAIDQTSPYYNEENKVSIFYAESWALVHYLMVGDRGAHRQPLADFLQFLGEGAPTQQAAERAFGDLNKLEKALYRYIGLRAFYSMGVKAPSEIDEKEFAARALSPAEAVARQGDFLAHSNRPAEARAALEEALALDPHLALAQEGMGLLAYMQGDREGAEKWYGEAAQQNSQNFMAQFFDGMLKLQHSREPEVLAQAAASLQRSIALNPNFAPAYETLASLY
jgi:tetratricopeptide (TPR) repeat protein